MVSGCFTSSGLGRLTIKENVRPSVHVRKLESAQFVQQDNDQKHTSKAKNQNEGFEVVCSKSGLEPDWDILAWP